MLIAVAFVMLWSTGFIGAKFGLPFAEPFTFLLVRFSIVSLLLTIFALATQAPWPRTLRETAQIAISGLFIHAVFLSGVFSSLYNGVPTGVTALIVGLQPVLTAIVVGPFLGEKVSIRQWLGVCLGLLGVVLVVQNKLSFSQEYIGGCAWSIAALVGITFGTIYQKKFCSHMDLRSGTVIQYVVAAIAMAILAFTFESMKIQWTGKFVFALMWLSLVLSVGAITLLYMLIRQGRASSVASLFYLVPPCTALIGYFTFGEHLGPTAIFGMFLAVVGVAVVVWGGKANSR